MPRLVGLTFVLAVTGAPSPRPLAPEATQAVNTLEIMIGSGPHAGIHKLPAQNIICLYVKARNRFSAAYRNVDARDPKVVSGAGINIFNPDDAGPKEGQVNLTFGDPNDKGPALYDIFIPGDSKGPLTMTRKGSVVDLAFEGLTKKGVKVRMTATCADVTEL